MSRWFRMYAEAMRNPKVARLSDKDFRVWVQLLAIASENGGRLPPAEDLKFMASMRLDHLLSALDRLIRGGLIDVLDCGYEPHHWDKFQYKSDTSTDRVLKHRRSRNVSVTAPETETETDIPVAKATAEIVPIGDPEKVAFDTAIRFLGSSGISEARARPIIGKWKRDHGPGAVIEAVGAAQRQGVIDPVGWIEARWRTSERAQPAVPL